MERFNRERARKLLQKLGVQWTTPESTTYYVLDTEAHIDARRSSEEKMRFKRRIKFMEAVLEPIIQRKIKDIRMKPYPKKV